MKGLLIKDYSILKEQGKQILMMCLIVMVLIMSGNSFQFVIMYATMLAVIMSLSNIAYDSVDNGMAFLMTLPVRRRDYVLEKYAFVIINALGVCILFTGICIIRELIVNGNDQVNEILLNCVVFILINAVFIAVLMPVYLKYGGEKGRIVFLIIFGMLFAGGMLIAKTGVDIPGKLTGAVTLLKKIGTTGIIAAGAVFTLMLMLLSYLLSDKIVKKQEF